MVVLAPALCDLGHMRSLLRTPVSFSVKEKESSLPGRVVKRAQPGSLHIVGTWKNVGFILFPSGKLFAFWKVVGEGGK